VPETASIPCSLESIEANESLIGSAPRADVWFALEYPGRWGDKAWAESTVDPSVKAHIDGQLKQIPESRLLLIKQRNRGEGIRFFASTGAKLYSFQFDDYLGLLSLDLVALAQGSARYESALTSQQVFFICTNGHRDQCCALHGMASYNALAARYGHAVWESTHHGGHRFAANLIALPAGLSFGRMRHDNAIGIVEAVMDGRIDLNHFRGRTGQSEQANAAETLLRRELGLDKISALRFTDTQIAGENRWRASFANGASQHIVLIERRKGGAVHASCGDEKTMASTHYELIEHYKP
jgi:hypothetical protein